MREHVPILQLLWVVFWTVGSTFVTWRLARGRAAKEEIAAIRVELDGKADQAKVGRMEGKLTEHDRRVQKLEGDFIHLPSLDLFHQLAIDLTEMRGDMKAIGATLKTVTETTRRIDDYLRDHD